jgi:type III pantothenate kinase
LESDPIYLLIDAGNTRIKWGVHDGRAWLVNGVAATADSGALSAAWAAIPAVKRAVASNVAGFTVRDDLERACKALGVGLRVMHAEPSLLGVTNGYRDPSQLGSDRWAALVAAHHLMRGNKLVVMAGTALTIDALTDDGKFLGGLIVPGPGLMRRALDRGTAGLRQTEGAFMDFPSATPDAITSGAVQACAGAVARMRDAMTARGLAPARVLLSGGAAPEIAGHLPLPHDIRENLVLDGLALIAPTA